MDIQSIKKYLELNLGFTKDKIDKIDEYLELLLNFNKKYNLIGKKTEENAWERHILDSAQLVKYINFEEATENYKYPKLSKKLCLLASSSSKETSNEIDDMKHSVFSYFLMKGLKGDAYGDDKILEIGELAEYLYRKIPDYTKNLENGVLQNPEFIGSDLKRVLIDLR